MFFSRSKSTIPTPEEALAGRPERPFHLSPQHLVLDAPLVTDPRSPRGTRRRSSASAASGAPRRSTGGCRRLVHVGRLRRRRHRRTRRTRRCARTDRPHRGRARRLRPARSSRTPTWSSVLRGARPDPGHAPGQRRRHPVPLGIYATTPEQEQIARELTKEYGEELAPPRLRPDHHGDQARRGRRAGVLLRRGLPPAVPVQEPQRVPLPQHHRSPVPGSPLNPRDRPWWRTYGTVIRVPVARQGDEEPSHRSSGLVDARHA